MGSRCARCMRPILGAVAVLVLAGGAKADWPGDIVRVEEDWELVVGAPDPDSDGPQVNCVLATSWHEDAVHATFEINHGNLPTFVAGGLHLQLWDGETNLSTRKFPQPQVMSTAGEVVRWTQSAALADGALTFEITAGSSTTWGPFGGQGYLRSSTPTNLSNLDNYSPDNSVQNSGVSYAANRVQSLVLKRVRVLTSDGQVYTDETERIVHQLTP